MITYYTSHWWIPHSSSALPTISHELDTCLFLNPARCCRLKGTTETSSPMLETGAQNMSLALAIQPVLEGWKSLGTTHKSHQPSPSRVREGSNGLPTALSSDPQRNEKQGWPQDLIKIHLHLLVLGFFSSLPHGGLLLTPSIPEGLSTFSSPLSNLSLLSSIYYSQESPSHLSLPWGFPAGSDGKESACIAGDPWLPIALYPKLNTWLLFL